MDANRAKTLYLWGFLYDVTHKRGGYTPDRVSGGALLQPDDTDDDGYGIYVFVWEFERVVFPVVRNYEYVVFVSSGLYTFDDCPLCGVEYVRFVPLEEHV